MPRSRIALTALAALAASAVFDSSFAADLGGNCCADLEERIAELEATTARKGNRKVSLTISGWVAEQVTYWDDGFENNVYVTGVGSTIASNVKFLGEATIVPGWTAGYLLHIEADGSDAATTNQTTPVGPNFLHVLQGGGTGNAVQTMQSYWFVKSASLGKVSIGLQSMVSDNAAILVDGSGSLVSANYVAFDVASFALRTKGTGAPASAWVLAGACIPGDCYGVPMNAVRYDSPTFAGFSVSASWGDDEVWDIGLRYAGEVAGFKVAATAVYAESSGTSTSSLYGDSEYFQAGLYLQHIGTGLFGLVNYASIEDNAPGAGQSGVVFFRGDGDTWYFKGGIRQRWTSLGHTVLYGEYLTSEGDDFNLVVAPGNRELEWYGLGAVQEIDNAGMSLWLKFRNFEASDNSGVAYEDMTEVTFGALIGF